jgi:hypothetical protein
VGDVTITNNFIWSQTFSNGGFQSGLLLNPGHGAGSCSDLAGKITIAGNTIDLAPRRYCGGDSPGFGMIALTDFDETSTCRQQTFEVRDNAFVNRRTDGQGLFIATDWAPSGWVGQQQHVQRWLRERHVVVEPRQRVHAGGLAHLERPGRELEGLPAPVRERDDG